MTLVVRTEAEQSTSLGFADGILSVEETEVSMLVICRRRTNALEKPSMWSITVPDATGASVKDAPGPKDPETHRPEPLAIKGDGSATSTS